MGIKPETVLKEFKEKFGEFGFDGTLSDMRLPESTLGKSPIIGSIRISEIVHVIYCCDNVGDCEYAVLQHKYGLPPETALEVAGEVKAKVGDNFFAVYDTVLRVNAWGVAKHREYRKL